MCSVRRCLSSILLLLTLCVPVLPARADGQPFFDDGESLVLLAADPVGVIEPAVSIYHNGTLIGGHRHKVVEAFDRVPGTSGYPLTFVDLVANTYLRMTYQKPDGTTGSLGSSVVGSPSFRTAAGLQFIPTVTRSDVHTPSAVDPASPRYSNLVTGRFGSAATVTSTRTFPDPSIGRTTVDLAIDFQVQEDVELATGTTFVDNDRLRLLTVSSMFASADRFDANLVRWEAPDGAVRTLPLTDHTPRGRHLLTEPEQIGTWFELIKGPQSTWFPDSPSLRVEILERDGLTLGLQGFLDESTDPNSDSLSCYLEVLEAPNTLPAGTRFDVQFRITAIPEPATPASLAILTVFLLLGYVLHRKRPHYVR